MVKFGVTLGRLAAPWVATALLVVASAGLSFLAGTAKHAESDANSSGARGGLQILSRTSYLPSNQQMLNATQLAGDCPASWDELNHADDRACSFAEVDRSPSDQLGMTLLPDGTHENGWRERGTMVPQCSTDATPHDELDDGPDSGDGAATCRHTSIAGSRVAVTLANPAWSDALDVDDVLVRSSAVVEALPWVNGDGNAVSLDLRVAASAYDPGPSENTSISSYVRYNRTDALSPFTDNPWTAGEVDGLIVAVRCVDCFPHEHRVTQIQAKVDARYDPEYDEPDDVFLDTTDLDVVRIDVGGLDPPFDLLFAWGPILLGSALLAASVRASTIRSDSIPPREAVTPFRLSDYRRIPPKWGRLIATDNILEAAATMRTHALAGVRPPPLSSGRGGESP